MKIAVFCLTLNVLLTFALVWRFEQSGLGIANSLSGICNMGLLFYALRRKLSRLGMAEVLSQVPGILGAAVLAGGTAWGLARLWETRLGHDAFFLKIGAVFVPLSAALAVYYGLTLWMKIKYARETLGLLVGRLRTKSPA